jgi:hypothetical protein
VAVYKVANGQVGVSFGTADVVKVCNTIMAVIPMSEPQVAELLSDLNSLQAVATGMGGIVQLTPHGKNIVESSGFLVAWAAFEKWLREHPPKV